MLRLDDDEIALARVALLLMRDESLYDGPMQQYVEGKADALIKRIEQYQQDVKNGDAP